MPRIDLIDLSHHNTVSDPHKLDGLPVWHKVNEGRKLDSAVNARLTWIVDRERWGGYTVLLPEGGGRSTIRQQLEVYADVVGPHWGRGAGTQLDVESWSTGPGTYRYGRPVSAAEIDEAIAVHVELLGRIPFVYANRNEPGMGPVFDAWRARNPGHPYWMPHYGRGGPAAAIALRADIHQWSSTTLVPGVVGGCDVNEIINPAALDIVCGITAEEATPMPPANPAPILWNPRGYANVFLIGAGPAVQLSPAAFAYYRDVVGLTFLEQDDHPAMLDSVLHQSGLTATALAVRP
jgi:hypothetical protein